MNRFWAKYLPDGTLDSNLAGVKLAGRVTKGADQGCIASHEAASGGDYLYVTNTLRRLYAPLSYQPAFRSAPDALGGGRALMLGNNP